MYGTGEADTDPGGAGVTTLRKGWVFATERGWKAVKAPKPSPPAGAGERGGSEEGDEWMEEKRRWAPGGSGKDMMNGGSRRERRERRDGRLGELRGGCAVLCLVLLGGTYVL